MCSSTNTAHYRGAPGCIFWLDLTGGSRMKVSKEYDLFAKMMASGIVYQLDPFLLLFSHWRIWLVWRVTSNWMRPSEDHQVIIMDCKGKTQQHELQAFLDCMNLQKIQLVIPYDPLFTPVETYVHHGPGRPGTEEFSSVNVSTALHRLARAKFSATRT